jgi:hypothetical protein
MREHRDEEECGSGEGPLLRAANAAAGPEHDQGTPPLRAWSVFLVKASRLLSLPPLASS